MLKGVDNTLIIDTNDFEENCDLYKIMILILTRIVQNYLTGSVVVVEGQTTGWRTEGECE